MSTTAAPLLTPKQHPAYEFMRRKRWADLLVTELSDAIVLVLSPEFKVLFCGHTVHELLGWKDEELVDADLVEMMNADDRDGFRKICSQSLADRQHLLTYVRLRCKQEYFTTADIHAPSREVLVEIYGYPHFEPDAEECKCFYAIAKPNPSRNTAMLNTLVELRLEKDSLQKQLQSLQARSQELSTAQASRTAATYPMDSMSARIAASLGLDIMPGEPSRPYYPFPQQGYSDTSYILPPAEEDGEEIRKKKRGKTAAAEQAVVQYVCFTCGRTDSPEWRRGSRGPKTLCNACGLRWAKKRKSEGAAEGGSAEPAPKPEDLVPT